MKKLLLTICLAAITEFAHGQGTIAFGNGTLTRVMVCDAGQLRNATAADGLTFAVFFGPASSFDLTEVQQPAPKATIGGVPGIMINAPSVFALPGTEPGQVVSLQIRAWTAFGLTAQTDIRQVTLGPTAGPAAVIWQTFASSNPNRFHPMVIVPPGGNPDDLCIPEPSTFALGAMGALFLLFFRLRHRSTHK
jgi:hypothetical protein